MFRPTRPPGALRPIFRLTLLTAAWACVCSGQINIQPDTLPTAAIGVPYGQLLSGSPAGNFSWSITQGALPPGLNGNQISSGDFTQFAISGTATTLGSYNFTVRAVGTTSTGPPPVGQRQYTITVSNALALTTTSPLPGGTVATAYSTTFVATGGTTPYSFTASGVPLGLSLSTAGVLSGTPTTAGNYNLQVSVTDKNSTIVTKPYTLSIAAPVTPVVITTTSPLPIASTGRFYTLPLAASGGTGPYTFSFTGTVAPGISFSGAGVLSGTPTTPGIYNFVVTATDSLRATGSKPFQLAVGTAGQSLLLLTNGLNFTAPQGGDPTSPQTIVTLSATGSSVPFVIAGDDGAGGPVPSWLTGKPLKGSTPARAQFMADPGNLPAGTYNARLRFFSGNEPAIEVPLRFVVTPSVPKLRAIPSVLRYFQRFSQPGTEDQSILVQNPGGGGPLDFQARIIGASPWATLSATSGQTAPGLPAVIKVRVNTLGLAVGVYRDTVRISSVSGTDDVLITLFVTPDGPVLRLPTTGVVIPVRQGHTQSAKSVVRVLNIGSLGSQVNYSVDVVSNPSFLTVTPSSFAVTPLNPATLTLTLAPGADALTPGAYYALVRVSDRAALNSPQLLSVVLVVLDPNSVSSLEVSQSGFFFLAGVAFPTSSKQFTVTSSSADRTPFSVAANTDS
ncbi:MAG TPA: Ig domain-containing protein, partial [Bryobacteraceae bacterium]|nr:Ig domain-containing protein [Bryobacteraceae bacterium]